MIKSVLKDAIKVSCIVQYDTLGAGVPCWTQKKLYPDLGETDCLETTTRVGISKEMLGLSALLLSQRVQINVLNPLHGSGRARKSTDSLCHINEQQDYTLNDKSSVCARNVFHILKYN